VTVHAFSWALIATQRATTIGAQILFWSARFRVEFLSVLGETCTRTDTVALWRAGMSFPSAKMGVR